MIQSERRRKTRAPCAVCRLHPARCVCAHLPRLALTTRVALVIHHREVKRTTNTGLLATHALVNSSVHVRGRPGHPVDLTELTSPEYENVVLYPSEDAVDVATFRATKPVRLIVADGNWRQAAKVPRREPALATLPRVFLPRPNAGVHHLRAEHLVNGYSTLEAVARALGALEGAHVEAALLNLYALKLAATLAGRGA